MGAKMDRQGAKTFNDLEYRYYFEKRFKEIENKLDELAAAGWRFGMPTLDNGISKPAFYSDTISESRDEEGITKDYKYRVYLTTEGVYVVGDYCIPPSESKTSFSKVKSWLNICE